MPTVLRPTAAIAPDALLPGDPARAMAIATELLEAPLMSNHAHGLWGYGGETAAGQPLTIQSTGIGAPSAALVLCDLAELGVTRAVMVGTCVGLGDGVQTGDLVVCERAIAGDGTSRALGAGGESSPDSALVAALREAAGDGGVRVAAVASTDLIAAPSPAATLPPQRIEAWTGAGAIAAEMQAAALFELGARLGVRVAGVLVVTDVTATPGSEAGDELLAAAALAAARLALEALSG